jgi:hypothetical protein
MSTQEILSQVGLLSLSERMALLEAILQSVKADIKNPEEEKKKAAEWEEVLRRRREFKVKAYHLGKDLKVDRDEIYAERGL